MGGRIGGRQRQASSRQIEDEDFRPDKIDLRSCGRKRKKRRFADIDSRQRGLGDLLIVLIDEAYIREPEFEPPIIGEPENGVANAKAVALKLRVQPFFDCRRQEGERYGTGQEARVQRGDCDKRSDNHGRRSAAAKPDRAPRRLFDRRRDGVENGFAAPRPAFKLELHRRTLRLPGALLLGDKRPARIFRKRTIIHASSPAPAPEAPARRLWHVRLPHKPKSATLPRAFCLSGAVTFLCSCSRLQTAILSGISLL